MLTPWCSTSPSLRAGLLMTKTIQSRIGARAHLALTKRVPAFGGSK